ncbi:formate--tetrahydrofolate ligase [Corynebacterium hindlerae]|uniref:Formate--tetrahydrofolate ligase n=1 Tax=Corynebacterium hindlerae TaxID=699041 RepID=A0A7G5FFB3_9CORY|nr:formate--tetrahydrofolate ligase [Corynebacterium hindlerae]
MTQPQDFEIASAHTLEPIATIAERAGIPTEHVIGYGRGKAKIDVAALPDRERTGKLLLVTAMSPTLAGEGKSTVLIGLADAIRAAGHRTIVAIREPSQGPVMGIKGALPVSECVADHGVGFGVAQHIGVLAGTR